ncbi:MAG: ABC transporter permease [Methanosarcinaceae archaeon]
MTRRINFRKITLIISLSILSISFLAAFFAPWIAFYPPDEFSGSPLERPGATHLLGTNDLGQDLFSRLIYGTRATLIIGFLGALVSGVIATGIGMLAGYYGGFLDECICRFIDVIMTVPTFPLLLVLSIFLNPGIYTLSFLMGVLGGTHGIRVIRSQVLSLSESNFIYGTRALGVGDFYIILVHVFPNILPLVLVQLVFSAQKYMLMGVGLGFLGIVDPSVIDWGQMINRAYSSGGFALGLWWWLLPPGLSVTVLSVSFALFGYSFEEKINPRLEGVFL